MNGMTIKSKAVTSAMAGLLTIAATGSIPVVAADQASTDNSEMEACYGVVKSGKNDCAGPEHACAGLSKAVDGNPQEHINLPKGTCARLTGGSLHNSP